MPSMTGTAITLCALAHLCGGWFYRQSNGGRAKQARGGITSDRDMRRVDGAQAQGIRHGQVTARVHYSRGTVLSPYLFRIALMVPSRNNAFTPALNCSTCFGEQRLRENPTA